MTHAQTNAAFLAAIDSRIGEAILDNIAAQYSVTRQEALDEVCDPEAEHLLDYITGPTRAIAALFMSQLGLRPATATREH